MKATGEVMAIDRTFEARAAEGDALAGAAQPTRLQTPALAEDGLATMAEQRTSQPNDARLWNLLDTLRNDTRDTACSKTLQPRRASTAGFSPSCAISC